MSPLTPPPRICPKGTDRCLQEFVRLWGVGRYAADRGSCSDDRHDDGRRRPLEVDSVVCDELCASLVAGPPGRVSIAMRKGSRITEPPSVVTPHRRWAAALTDSLIAFDPPVTSCGERCPEAPYAM